MIKTALSCAVLGTFLSTLWLLQLAWPLHPLLAHLQPTALHLIVVGWLTQLIFAIALWMFPVWSKAQPRGPTTPTWLCYALLNGGLLLRVIAEPSNSYRPTFVGSWVLVSAAVMQVAAVWVFVLLIWRRVRAKHGGR